MLGNSSDHARACIASQSYATVYREAGKIGAKAQHLDKRIRVAYVKVACFVFSEEGLNHSW